jgi:microcystin-dependent protein
MAEPYLGEIRMVGFNFNPQGWQLCQGQLLSISEYTALFSLLGTSYGGNGTTNFALPDLRGRIPMHQGSGSTGTYGFAEQGGSETVTLTTGEMPQHNHLLNAQSGSGNQASPSLGYFAGSDLDQFSSASPTTTMSNSLVAINGGSQPHDNMSPFLCVNFVIAMEGVYPSRS